ncbi:hypothetical protein D3C71_2230820 [compost metagenome]
MREFKLVHVNNNDFALYDEEGKVVLESNEETVAIDQIVDTFELTLRYLKIDYVIKIGNDI